VKNFSDDIFNFNLSYLILAKEMISHDREKAAFYLGVSAKVIQEIQEIPADRLISIARQNQLIFECRFKKSIKEVCSESRIKNLKKFHAGIVLLGEE
jgi:flagellar transcriptional activator FlhD